jgi:hypothetical protein
MKVAQYREMIRALLQQVNDWHACVSDTERQAWAQRAVRVHAELAEAQCPRATLRDAEMRAIAERQYLDLTAIPAPSTTASLPPSSTARHREHGAGQSRAAKYNKSAGRAVRLSRATRSAMRRGYM